MFIFLLFIIERSLNEPIAPNIQTILNDAILIFLIIVMCRMCSRLGERRWRGGGGAGEAE